MKIIYHENMGATQLSTGYYVVYRGATHLGAVVKVENKPYKSYWQPITPEKIYLESSDTLKFAMTILDCENLRPTV